MKPGTVLNLVGTWKHRSPSGVTMTMKLNQRCGTRALLIELEGDLDRETDLDVAMAKIGWVRKPL